MATLALALAVSLLLGHVGQPADSARARRLWLAALEQEAQLRLDSAFALLRAAQRADPGFLPAAFEYMEQMRVQGAPDLLRREYPASSARDRLQACLAAAATAPFRVSWLAVPALEGVEARWGPSDCSAAFLSQLMHVAPGDRAGAERRLAHVRRALKAAPEVPELWLAYGWTLRARGDTAAAEAAAREGLARVPPGIARLRLQLGALDLLAARDTAARARQLRALGSEVLRDRRPGVRAAYLVRIPHYGGYAQALTLLRAAGAWQLEFQALEARAHGAMDEGELTLALRDIQRALTLADRHRRPALQLLAYTLRGRIYGKMGLAELAERDLLRAVQVGEPIGEAYLLGEAYHNLAHVYEERRDWPRAARTIDRFVQLYDPFLDVDARVVSLYDAATIRWKAGWHAAAARSFEAMVRAVEQQQALYTYAGEYYERVGNLRLALSYYRRGIAGDRPLALAGMTRAYDALGMHDSAQIAARAHDALRAISTDGPLLPLLLARHGRTEAALRSVQPWIDHQRETGNVQAMVVGLLERSEILLASRQPGAAATDAARAESLATRMQLTRERIRAQRLRGSALMALGRSGAALWVLRRAADAAERRPEAGVTLESFVALANALADAGRSADALVAYDRAARSVERVTTLLADDVDRARFRDVHMAPFDGAVRVLLRLPDTPARLDAFLRWSERRKAAALALATGDAGGGRPGPSGVASLRARLGAGEALIDFTVVDSTIVACVVTRQGARLRRLPVALDSVARWTEAVRRPLVAVHAGRIDLARATFDASAAARLHAALVAPLEPEVRGARRLLLVPDGVLHDVPFDALVLPQSRAGDLAAKRYLLDRYEIAYLPSPGFLRRRPGAGRVAGRLLLAAYDAPGGARELSAVESAWRGPVRALAGALASETTVRRDAPAFSVIHLATHAVADDGDPLASHLLLAPGDGNDGLLHIPEIASGRLFARLVVLSGCETLSGPSFRGEGLMGLARAFLAAGAGAVLATRWPVGDATADLMAVFYRHLAAGDDPASALRAAQLALRRDPARAHPFFWAGFVLVSRS